MSVFKIVKTTESNEISNDSPAWVERNEKFPYTVIFTDTGFVADQFKKKSTAIGYCQKRAGDNFEIEA